MSRSTLEIDGDCLAVAEGGTLEVEYALFDPCEIELAAKEPGTIREAGYRTVVADARARLERVGITPDLAEELTSAAKPVLARAYARGPAVRRIADRLTAAELFDGATYDPCAGLYSGAWLDLPALVAALVVELADADPDRPRVAIRTASLLQGLHLAARLAEHPGTDQVVLTTAPFTATRRPGERTFRRTSLDSASCRPGALIDCLRRLSGGRERSASENGPGRQEITARLGQRSQRIAGVAERVASIEAVLGSRSPPARGPLSDAELWAVEAKLSIGETEGVADRIDSIERRRGRLPATTYLRARIALISGTEQPRAIAERVSDLSTSMAAFHQLRLLAAQAWAEAGDVRRAHAFARDLLDDPSACDALRMHARDVLEATSKATTAPEGGWQLIPKPPLAPSGTALHVHASSIPAGGADCAGWSTPLATRADRAVTSSPR